MTVTGLQTQGSILPPISRELQEIFADSGATEQAVSRLKNKGVRRVEAFADPAESRQEIIEVVGRPSGPPPPKKTKVGEQGAEEAVKGSQRAKRKAKHRKGRKETTEEQTKGGLSRGARNRGGERAGKREPSPTAWTPTTPSRASP